MTRQEISEAHAKEPQVGDYWHEMFTPIMVVTAVQHGHVFVCNKFKQHEDGVHITPDYGALSRVFSINEFYNYVHYDTEKMPGKTWCDVMPARQEEPKP